MDCRLCLDTKGEGRLFLTRLYLEQVCYRRVSCSNAVRDSMVECPLVESYSYVISKTTMEAVRKVIQDVAVTVGCICNHPMVQNEEEKALLLEGLRNLFLALVSLSTMMSVSFS